MSGGCSFRGYSSFLPLPELSIQTAITNRLRHMVRLDLGGAFQIGNGAGHAQDAVMGPSRQTETLHRRLQKLPPRTVQHAELPQLPAAHARVETDVARTESLALHGPGPADL